MKTCIHCKQNLHWDCTVFFSISKIPNCSTTDLWQHTCNVFFAPNFLAMFPFASWYHRRRFLKNFWVPITEIVLLGVRPQDFLSPLEPFHKIPSCKNVFRKFKNFLCCALFISYLICVNSCHIFFLKYLNISCFHMKKQKEALFDNSLMQQLQKGSNNYKFNKSLGNY